MTPIDAVTTPLKETPLANLHRELGARMVDFAGWNMPVQYNSIIKEHLAVRKNVGLFDVSHMGEFIVSGANAASFIQQVIANDINRLQEPNTALYSQLLLPSAGTIDDLIVYRRPEDFLLVVNASNIQKDWNWLSEQIRGFELVSLLDISDEMALLALQGPDAVLVLSEIIGRSLTEMKSFTSATGTVDGISFSFARTGYTGEDGFEIFVLSQDAVRLWQILMASGAKYAIAPCGLGARDTLRLEAAYPLYGHELDENTSPLAAGLGWSVKLDKPDFSGKEALLKQKAAGLSKTCVCLRVDGKALPRQGYEIFSQGLKIGVITSGSQGIFVGYPLAMAYVLPEYASVGTTLQVKIRDNFVDAVIVKRPFYKRN